MEKTKKKLFESVKTKLTVLIVAIMAIPLIISIAISYSTSHSEAVSNMDQMNTEQSKLVQHDFKTIVDQNYQILQTVANSVSARKVLKGELDAESVQDWLHKTDETAGDGNVLAIVNADGMQIVKASGDPVDVSDREYFQQVKATGKFYASNQNISKTTGKRIATFIYPVFDLDGTFIGAVQRNIDLGFLNELVKSEISADKQDIFIGDNNGDLIAHSSMDLDGGEPVNFASQQWFTDSRDNLEASGSYDSKFDGGNWRMSYMREPVTGWTTVIASDVGVALRSSNRMLSYVIIIGLIMLAIAIAVSIMMSKSFTKPILEVNESIDKLSNGEFLKIEDEKVINRKDEFGDIVKNINSLIDKLMDVVENIKNASDTVTEQAGNLSDTSSQISTTTNDVSLAVNDMANGATDQANTVEKASENIQILSDAIQTVAQNAEQLAGAAADMDEASQSSADALKQLSDNMEKMGTSVNDITETMNATNAAVQKVNEKVDGITSIATQTNLLALNASIEAARAGDAGRGFAVVAEEIGQLATQSATTAEEIRNEMANLLKQAQEAIVKTGEIAEIGTDVNEVLTTTVDTINKLIGDVGVSVGGVNNISALTQECDASKVEIVDAMSSLSAISEENAASTEETSASMSELNNTINILADSAKSLNDVAVKLNEDLSFFKL